MKKALFLSALAMVSLAGMGQSKPVTILCTADSMQNEPILFKIKDSTITGRYVVKNNEEIFTFKYRYPQKLLSGSSVIDYNFQIGKPFSFDLLYIRPQKLWFKIAFLDINNIKCLQSFTIIQCQGCGQFLKMK